MITKTMADTKPSRNGQKMMQTIQLGRELTSICKWLTVHKPVHVKTKQQNVTKLQQLYLQQKFISLAA